MTTPTTDVTPDPNRREITLTRTGQGAYEARNARGGTLGLGTGQTADFTPVEALLAAIAGCSAVDVDALTTRRAEPLAFDAVASGVKLDDADGHHLGDVQVHFTVTFPAGQAGDAAREMLPRVVRQSRDRLCTVSRTVALPTPVEMTGESPA